jgi:hypothetical protein
VVGVPLDPDPSSGNFTELIEKVRHRVDCRIEVVQEKDLKPTGKRRR